MHITWSQVYPWLVEAGVILHVLVTFWLVVRVLQQQRNNGVAIAWIAILFAMPFVGIVAYFLFGETNIGRQYRRRSMQAQLVLEDFAKEQGIDFNEVTPDLSPDAERISRLGFYKTGIGVYDGHQVTLLTEPQQIFEHLRHDIEQAKHTILLEFYIVHPKGRVEAILQALIDAVARGVEVHILADSVGSHEFFKSGWLKRLKNANIHIHESFPVGLFKTLVKRIDIRNHRKIAVFDNDFGYTGSFNLVDPDFFKQDSHVGKWVDMMIRVENHQKVNIVKAMTLVTTTDISAETQNNLSNLNLYINNFTKRLYPNDELRYKGKTIFQLKNRRPLPPSDVAKPTENTIYPTVDSVAMQLIPSAPELTGHVIYETLICAIFNAKHSIFITTPYFVPDEALLLALTTVAKQGIQVTLNVPKKVDSKLVHYASRAYYQPLLDAGVTIALFTGGLLHAKIVTIDEDYCLFGTVNMDMRSFYLNMEVSVAIFTQAMIEQLLTCQKNYLAQSEYLDPAEWQQRHFLPKFLDNGIRLFSPLL